MSQSDKFTKSALEILRRIVPWASEASSIKLAHRSNYKGVRGRIGIVGGVRDYAGAPYFASIASMRLGADLAYVICSQEAAQAIKNYSPDLIVMPILDNPDESAFKSEISCLLDRLHALVIGPGLGREKLMLSRARQLILEAKARSLPLVLDADSLKLVNEDSSLVKSYPNAILTPNRIELQRMLEIFIPSKDLDLRTMQSDEIRRLVKQCSTKLEVTILAKGSIDYISSPGQEQVLETDEMSGSNRRCGGQGDILAGLTGAYFHWIRQASNVGEQIENQAAYAAYLASITTRLTNELAYKDYRNGMIASHMIDKIHIAFDQLLDRARKHQAPQALYNLSSNVKYTGSLNQDEIKRYARQMIMEEFGPQRQLNLKKSSALIIGAGGLGCPVAAYLGAGGIGRIGIVDDDRVEASNLHRQILHTMDRVGMLKTESIKTAVLAINPNVQVDTHSFKLTSSNAVELFKGYDMIIDATDNLLSRYLISDASVVAKKPLISGAALKMDGQLTVYNYDHETPCFRCLFPEPPAPSAVGSCSENGVLGVLPGIIGLQQALEALKIGSGIRPAFAGKMLLFDGQLGLFRHIQLRKKRPDCEACGIKSQLDCNLIDYEKFCGSQACNASATKGVDILESHGRVTVQEYLEILNSNKAHVLVDVRPSSHSDVSKFAHALAIPVAKLLLDDEINSIREALESSESGEIYVVCRKGIASQRGARILQEHFKDTNVVVRDIIGGMSAWARYIDPNYSCV